MSTWGAKVGGRVIGRDDIRQIEGNKVAALLSPENTPYDLPNQRRMARPAETLIAAAQARHRVRKIKQA